MKKIRRLLSILFVLILFVQSTSLAFAFSNNEQDKNLDIVFQELSTAEIKAEVQELRKQVQEARKNEKQVTRSQDEVAAIALAEEKAEAIHTIEKEVQDCVSLVMNEASSSNNDAAKQEIQKNDVISMDEEPTSNNNATGQEGHENNTSSIDETSSSDDNAAEQELQENIVPPTDEATSNNENAAAQEIYDNNILSSDETFSSNSSSSDLSELFSGGDGTEQDPYIITIPTQMADISQDLSAYYSLDNDIDMSQITWTPLDAFTGQFDGNMHVISNLTISSSATVTALFGSSNGATIENIILRDAYISGVNYVGGFVGLASNTTFSNLTLESSEISGVTYVGSIAGACTANTEIYECYSNGTIDSTGEVVGGIVGFMNGTTIDDCIFEGEVSATNYYVGGIAGMLQCDANRCTNAGEVNGDYSVGGIAGIAYALTGRTVYVIRCFNSGDISGVTEIAGIAGYALSTGTGMVSINHSANQGNITASSNFAGGMTGDSGCDLYIQRCYNTGKIQGRIYGGLVGRLNPSTAYAGVLRYGYNAGENSSGAVSSGALIGINFGVLVNNLYYIGGTLSPVGVNGAYATYSATSKTEDAMRTIHTTLGSPHTEDSSLINGGFPIISGITYVFSEDYIFYPVVVVTYDGNGNTSGTAPANQYVSTPGNLNLASQGNMGKTGYEFKGWKTPDGTISASGATLTFTEATIATSSMTAFWIDPIRHLEYWWPVSSSNVTPIPLGNFLVDPYYTEDWVSVIEDSVDAWNNSTASITFDTSAYSDNTIDVVISTDTTFYGKNYAIDTSGISLNRYHIVLNGDAILAYVNNNSYTFDNVVQSVVTHELGHSIGLKDGFQGSPHNGSNNGSLMNHDRNRNTVIGPTSFDLASVNMIYG